MTALMIRCAGSPSPELAVLAGAYLSLQGRLDAARQELGESERGMTTETVIITAGLAALAVAIVAIIASRVRSRANTIP